MNLGHVAPDVHRADDVSVTEGERLVLGARRTGGNQARRGDGGHCKKALHVALHL
jgi:hypothetical protein